MKLEWDRTKAATNQRKHGVRFADAATVLHDEYALTVSDDERDEERLVTLGMDALGRLLVVVYTFRGDAIRLISARPATRPEQRQYSAARKP
jgi:hypothetical protein